jgi:hypothetical protein
MRIAVTLLSLSLAAPCLVHAADTARPAPSTLTRPKGDSQLVDSRGFIHRWFVLEPVPVPPGLTEPAVKESLKLASLTDGAQPGEGAKATINGAEYAWHPLDTINYNLNLYHFAWSLSKPTSNVVFWIETTVDSPQEMQNVRLAIGSNAASRWWLNGEPVIALNDDRQSVIDDGVSRRLTLRKGRNVIRAAIINGGGATDFCARFLDENDRPLVGLKTRL